jgi:hypothetical protein
MLLDKSQKIKTPLNTIIWNPNMGTHPKEKCVNTTSTKETTKRNIVNYTSRSDKEHEHQEDNINNVSVTHR